MSFNWGMEKQMVVHPYNVNHWWKGTNYWYRQGHWWLSDSLCQMKEARLKKLYNVWLFIWHCWKDKTIKENKSLFARDQGGEVGGGWLQRNNIKLFMVMALYLDCGDSHVTVFVKTERTVRKKEWVSYVNYTLKNKISNFTSVYIPKRSESRDTNGYSYTHIQSSKVEATRMSIVRWMDKKM